MNQRRKPPARRYYPEAALTLNEAHIYAGRIQPGYSPLFSVDVMTYGITAQQAREAAHLLNQLAEYLEETSN